MIITIKNAYSTKNIFNVCLYYRACKVWFFIHINICISLIVLLYKIKTYIKKNYNSIIVNECY